MRNLVYVLQARRGTKEKMSTVANLWQLAPAFVPMSHRGWSFQCTRAQASPCEKQSVLVAQSQRPLAVSRIVRQTGLWFGHFEFEFQSYSTGDSETLECQTCWQPKCAVWSYLFINVHATQCTPQAQLGFATINIHVMITMIFRRLTPIWGKKRVELWYCCTGFYVAVRKNNS